MNESLLKQWLVIRAMEKQSQALGIDRHPAVLGMMLDMLCDYTKELRKAEQQDVN